MSSNTIKKSLLLAFAALIWGVSFVAQSNGGKAIGPYSFNCIRSLIGAMVLLIVIFLIEHKKMSNRKIATRQEKKILLI